jgi:hypothetical protein
VSGLGAPATPTLTIVIGGILPPFMSNQMTSVVQSMVATSINISSPLIVGSTQPLSVASSSSFISNTFSFGMSSIDMQKCVGWFQLIPQSTNVGVGSSSTPLQDFPWGRGHIPLHHSPHLESGYFPSSVPNPFMGWGGPMGGRFQSI